MDDTSWFWYWDQLQPRFDIRSFEERGQQAEAWAIDWATNRLKISTKARLWAVDWALKQLSKKSGRVVLCEDFIKWQRSICELYGVEPTLLYSEEGRSLFEMVCVDYVFRRWTDEVESLWERKVNMEYEKQRRVDLEMLLLSLQSLLQSICLAILSPASVILPVWKKRLKSSSVSMPWAIPTALLILWSVVWMFRPGLEGDHSWYWQDDFVEVAPPFQSEPATVNADFDPNLSWDNFLSFQNYDQNFVNSDPWDLTTLPARGDSNPLADHGDFMPASAQDFSIPEAMPIFPSLPLESDGSVNQRSLSSNTVTSSSADITGNSPLSSSEPQAPLALAAASHSASFGANNKVSKASQRLERKRDATRACTHCSQTFKYQKDLTRHVRAVHQRKRDFACDFPGCGHRDSREDNLRRHKRKHDRRSESGASKGSTDSASPLELGLTMTTQVTADSRELGEIVVGEDLHQEDVAVIPVNEPMTRETFLEKRLREVETQLREERVRRMEAEDRLKMKERLEGNVKDVEGQLREERVMRIELEDKVRGVQDEIRELKESMRAR